MAVAFMNFVYLTLSLIVSLEC